MFIYYLSGKSISAPVLAKNVIAVDSTLSSRNSHGIDYFVLFSFYGYSLGTYIKPDIVTINKVMTPKSLSQTDCESNCDIHSEPLNGKKQYHQKLL